MLNKDKESVNNQPKPDENIRFWLALKFIPRLSIPKKLALLQYCSIDQLFINPPEKNCIALTEKQYNAIVSPNWQRIDEIIEQSAKIKCALISFEHSNYPQNLKEIYDPPLVLFVKGDSSILNTEQVAIVGSRNASVHGREAAYQFAQYLSQQGCVVTSGLALGIDVHAHKGVVDKQNVTIAVVATGLDICYPSRHRPLEKSIIENGGAIVSEFIPGTPPKPGHFPKRNRIISGMSEGVVVIEATLRSGSLITARCAIEHNREVFALPGNINNPQTKGCHWLIKQGALLVEEASEILDELNLKFENSLNLKGKQNRNKEKEKESKKSCVQDLFNDPLLASVGYEITPVDTVVSRSKLPIDVVLTRLTMLELRGLVSAVPGGYLKTNKG